MLKYGVTVTGLPPMVAPDRANDEFSAPDLMEKETMTVVASTAVMSCTCPQEEKRENISLASLYPGGQVTHLHKICSVGHDKTSEIRLIESHCKQVVRLGLLSIL